MSKIFKMPSLLWAVSWGLLVASAGSVASGQVIYEPVQHQYGTVYYGGTNPALIATAKQTCADDLGAAGLPYYYRSFGYIPLPGTLYAGVGNKVVDERLLALCDRGNFYCLGCTADEARNQAYANVPRYFRKGDLLATGIETEGVVIVPATPPRRGRIEIKPYAPTAPTNPPSTLTAPATQPAPILIIPKNGLAPVDRPLMAAR